MTVGEVVEGVPESSSSSSLLNVPIIINFDESKEELKTEAILIDTPKTENVLENCEEKLIHISDDSITGETRPLVTDEEKKPSIEQKGDDDNKKKPLETQDTNYKIEMIIRSTETTSPEKKSSSVVPPEILENSA